MDKMVVYKLTNQFDERSHTIPDEDIEFWLARGLQESLGYARWENFQTAISRAIESCKSRGYKTDDHFRGVTKMVSLGSGSERAITDEHVQNNKSERRMLGDRGIQPERLPLEEDIKKLERRVKTEENRLEKQSGRLPGPDTSTKQEH